MPNESKYPHPFVPELCEQLRKKNINKREFLRTVTCLGVSAPMAFGMAASILGTNVATTSTVAAQTPKMGGTLRVSMTVQAINDPSLLTWIDPSNIVRQITDYLVYVGPDNVARPMLAKRWQPSENLKTWDLWLQENAYFNNGDLMTADDIVQNFVHWTNPESKSINASLFKGAEVEKVSDFHVKIHLQDPMLALPENLYQYTTAVMHRGFGTEWEANFEKYPIGTGGFELVAFEVGRLATVRRRSDINAKSWRGRTPYLDEVQYIDIGNESAAQISALASKQVDVAYYVQYNDLDNMNNIPGLSIINTPATETALIRFNTEAPPFDNLELRKAIVKCANNQRFVDIITKGLGEVAEHHHVSTQHPAYAKLPFPHQDLVAAKEALAKSGWDTSKPLEVMVGNTQGTWETDAVQVLKEECAKIGLTLDINVLPTSVYWERWDQYPFSLTYWAHRPISVMLHALAYKTGAQWNETHFSSKTYDDALDKANVTPDPNERRKYMEVMQRELQDNYLMVQAFFLSSLVAVDEKVKDFEGHPTKYQPMFDTWIDA